MDSRPAINTRVEIDAIPAVMKAIPRWGLWRAVWVINKVGRGRWEKKPLLSTNEPEKWLTFEDALAQLPGKEGYGLGFCVTGLEEWIAFDLDHCLDDVGVPEPWAEALIGMVDSYTETTVGGDGVRIFARGHFDSDWINKDTVSLEVYSGHAGRFLTVSGKVWPGHAEVKTVSEAALANIAERYRISSASARGTVAEMPELLEGVEVPDGLNADAAEFLAEGRCDDDRSATLNWTARCLLEVGLSPQQVLTVLYENPYAMEVALDHRRQDEERALVYLWKHHVSAHADTARPRAGVGDFADEVEADELKVRLQAEVRRLASMDPLVFSKQAKNEAKELGVGVVELRKHVDRERKKRIKAAKKGKVDYITPLPHLDEDGVPRNHLDNLREILRRLEVTCRYNLISKEDEILIPGASYTQDNEANASLAWLDSECSLFNFPTSKLKQFLINIADSNAYNPVVTWVTSKPWDKVSRLQALYDTLKTAPEDKKRKEMLIRRWLISAIAVAFSPYGTQTRGVLVLQGPQYIGKTRWFMSLTPQHLKLAKEGVLLSPGNRDSVSQAVRHWMVELGELDATFKRSDISALNAFLTNVSDLFRRPYAPKDSHYVRRTVFFGSVNPDDFLHDPTGSTRFWAIPVTKVDHDHGIDMQQVWAEVQELWAAGEQHWLTSEESETLAKGNERFQVADPIQELLRDELNWEMPEAHWRWMTSSGVLRELGIQNPTRSQTTTCGSALTVFGAESKRSNIGTLRRVPYRNGVTLSFEDLA